MAGETAMHFPKIISFNQHKHPGGVQQLAHGHLARNWQWNWELSPEQSYGASPVWEWQQVSLP